MNYTVTTAEKKVLTFLQNRLGKTADEKLFIQSFSDAVAARRAIEGCLAKGFVSKDGNFLSLTALGELQL